MAITATDRAYIKANPGHVYRLVDLFIENANQPSNFTLSLAFAIGEEGLGAMTTPTDGTPTNIINSLKDFVDEIQS